MKGKLVASPNNEIDEFPLRDVFDVPDLSTTNDSIVNGTASPSKEEPSSLCLFTAQRVDYSLARLDTTQRLTRNIFKILCFLQTINFMLMSLNVLLGKL